MKVYELIALLGDMPAGASVDCFISGKDDSYMITEVLGGEDADESVNICIKKE